MVGRSLVVCSIKHTYIGYTTLHQRLVHISTRDEKALDHSETVCDTFGNLKGYIRENQILWVFWAALKKPSLNFWQTEDMLWRQLKLWLFGQRFVVGKECLKLLLNSVRLAAALMSIRLVRLDDWEQALDSLTFRSIFIAPLPLDRSNSWDAQLAIPNYPRYARLETNLGSGQAKDPYYCENSLVRTLLCKAKRCRVEKWFLEAVA
ncbi:hypothetical protein TNCV_4181131 [Trichonephila clavipes]|nr:hypothetical protein TNCV_4181131 [Trichonephila clavipes]